MPILNAIFLISSLSAFLLLPETPKAQTANQIRIDSMLSILPGLKEDTNKIKLLNDISSTYFTINPDEGIRRGEQAQALSKKLNWKKGLATSYHSLGANYWAKHELLQAQNCYWEGLKLNEALANKKGIANSLHDLAGIYEAEFNYPKSLEYYEKSLILFDEIGDKFHKQGCLANIANIYALEKNYDAALDYFKRSLKLCLENGNERDIAYMYGRIGAIYTLQGQYAGALEYETKSLRTLKKFPDKNDVAFVLGDIGEIYLKKHEFTKSLEYFEKVLKISESLNSNWAHGYAGKYSGYIGGIYLSMATDDKQNSTGGKINNKILIQKAVYNLKRGIDISLSVGDRETLRDCFRDLSKAQTLQGRYGAALESYQQYTLYKDSLNNTETDKEMNRHELENVYGNQKDSIEYLNKLQQSELHAFAQQKKLAQLSLKQYWLYSIIAFTLLSLIALYFLFRFRTQQLRLKNENIREKAEKQLKEAEHQRRLNDITSLALRSQMNPHFIFNALNTIQSYVYANDKKSATKYLGKFSELIRRILENSNKQTISLEEEIELLRLYLDIEKARFGDMFHVAIEISPDIDTEEIFIPPMLIQPYTENAIKHGLLHITHDRRLNISINKSEDQQYIEIIIEDNGIGREKSMLFNKNRTGHHSFANEANERRIDLLNQFLDKKATLEIIDKKRPDGYPSGTKVIINIPLISMTKV